jgi:hypothetical protein
MFVRVMLAEEGQQVKVQLKARIFVNLVIKIFRSLKVAIVY